MQAELIKKDQKIKELEEANQQLVLQLSQASQMKDEFQTMKKELKAKIRNTV